MSSSEQSCQVSAVNIIGCMTITDTTATHTRSSYLGDQEDWEGSIPLRRVRDPGYHQDRKQVQNVPKSSSRWGFPAIDEE